MKNPKIQAILNIIDSQICLLEDEIESTKWNDATTNKEDALSEVETLYVTVDDLEDILDRDEELAKIEQAVNEEEV
jgi:hypothetical protein